MEVFRDLAISGVLNPVPGCGMVALSPKRPPYVSHMHRRRHNLRHIAEKACVILFLSVPHRTLPVKYEFSVDLSRTQPGSVEPTGMLKLHDLAASVLCGEFYGPRKEKTPRM